MAFDLSKVDWSKIGGNALVDLGYGLSTAPLNNAFGAATAHGDKMVPFRANQKQIERQNALEQNLLDLQIQQRNATADWAEKGGHADWAELLRNGSVSGSDVFNLMNKQTVVPNGSSVINGEGQTVAGGTGGFAGTDLQAQAWNTVLRGAHDPAFQQTPEYQTAVSIVSQPKVTYAQGPDGLVPVSQQPTLPSFMKAPETSDSAPSAANGNITSATAIPGTKSKPDEQQRRAQMMDRVITPEVANLLGDGKNSGTFDALSNGGDVIKSGMNAATNDGARFLPFGMGTPSEQFLKAQGSIKTVVASYLYVASGATANPGEVQNQIDILTPKVNDPPNVVADKKARLATMAQAVKDAAAGKQVDFQSIDQPQAVGKVRLYNPVTGNLE